MGVLCRCRLALLSRVAVTFSLQVYPTYDTVYPESRLFVPTMVSHLGQ